MLIIFDLDDTLVETSKCLTPHALGRALDAMIHCGLNVERSEGFEKLITLNQKSLTSREALSSFVAQFGGDNPILQKGLEALSEPLPEEIPLEAVPGAHALIEDLKFENTLILVTLGSAPLQIQKMEKAGIQPEKFSTIIVEQGSSKNSIYQRVLKDKGCDPSDVLICGDRVPIDLSPGKKLGCTTVHFPNGRGMRFRAPQEDVDHTIPTLEALKEVIEKSKV